MFRTKQRSVWDKRRDLDPDPDLDPCDSVSVPHAQGSPKEFTFQMWRRFREPCMVWLMTDLWRNLEEALPWISSRLSEKNRHVNDTWRRLLQRRIFVGTIYVFKQIFCDSSPHFFLDIPCMLLLTVSVIAITFPPTLRVLLSACLFPHNAISASPHHLRCCSSYQQLFFPAFSFFPWFVRTFLTHSGKPEEHRCFLANMLEDFGLGVSGDVMCHLKEPKCTWKQQINCEQVYRNKSSYTRKWKEVKVNLISVTTIT